MPTSDKVDDREYIKIKDYIFRNKRLSETNIYDFNGKYFIKKRQK